jgi:endonuclease YncB( thermonuclease family)
MKLAARTVLLTALLTAFSLGIASPALAAGRGPCVAGQKRGPKCLIWNAKVKWAADGDTLKPLIYEKGKWSKHVVRMTGIQAMELHDYSRRSRSGECLGVKAANTLDKFVHHGIFRVVALHRTFGGGHRARLRRSLQVKRGGKWVDPAMTLLAKGLVLWSPDNTEWAWNGVYSRLTEQAQAKGVGLWNPEACGHPGPAKDAPLSMKVKWDGDGRDTPNSEWVRIKNAGAAPVSLRGWRLRDPDLIGSKMKTGYRFPANASIPAGGSVTVHVGKGKNANGVYYWGLGDTLFQNATNDKKQMGDGAYLYDPDDEVRAYVQYPCRTACSEPLAGGVSLDTRYMGTTYEWVTVWNTSKSPISLNEYEIESVPWFYEFGPRDILEPGDGVVVFVNKQPTRVPISSTTSNPLVLAVPGRAPFQRVTIFHDWNHTDALFGDKSDVVTLRNPLGGPVVCDYWGGDKCPGV